MSQELLIKEEVKIEVKNSFGGFKVISPDSCSYDSCDDAVREFTKENVDAFESVEVARAEFVKVILRDYKAGVEWKTSKYADSKGFFFLNGIKITWELESNYAGDMYHMDIHSFWEDNKTLSRYLVEWNDNSPSDRVPNDITETGYRSCFCSNLDCYDSMKEFLTDYVDHTLNSDDTGKRKKKLKVYDLSFEESAEPPKRQLTLLELQGGTNQ